MVRSAPSDDPGAAAFLGARIRGLRKRRALTLAQLAEAAGLSTGYISQLERNLASPSIPALVAIARALGVTVQWFFAGPVPAPAAEQGYVVRRGAGLRLGYAGGIEDELLTPRLSLQVEMIRCTLPEGGESAQSYSHEGDEVGLVLSGRLDLWVGERRFLLAPGDSFGFSSREPHRYRNPGPGPAVVLWAISPPSF